LEVNLDKYTVPNNSFVLCKYTDDYADEFDIEGFAIFTAKEFNTWLADQLAEHYPREHYFGTNESIEHYNREQFLDTLTIKVIDEQDYNTLKRLFGRTYGKFLF
jgi:hypothetical protein